MTTPVRVLLLSGLYDFSTDLIAAALAERGVSFVRLNREQLPQIRVTLDPIAAVMDVREVSGSTVTVSSVDLSSVLYRQPVFLRNTPGRALSSDEQLERSQWSAFLRGLCVFDRQRWMNHPAKTYLAESKPYQLRVAARLGFEVPVTRISNDVAGVRRANLGTPSIVKSVDTILINEGSDCLFTYSTMADVQQWVDDDLRAAPALCQELIKGKTDLRVTMVGDATFAVRIEEGGRGIEGDWRVRPRDCVEFVPVALPPDCARRCQQLAAILDLPFAAVDLIESADGRIFFIEVNPTGEWGWMVRYGLPIDRAIADWLSRIEAAGP